MLSIITTLIIFAFIMGVVVIVHELGHFVSAKISDMQVDEFSFGFGPKLWSRTKGETEYMIKAFPIGGYVKILGEEEESKSKRSFSEKPVRSRLLVAGAGVIMNMLLAVILFYVVIGLRGFCYEGVPYYEDFKVWFGDQEDVYLSQVTVVDIEKDSGADEAGLEEFFEIHEVDGVKIQTNQDLVEELKPKSGEWVVLKIEDEDGKKDTVKVEVDDEGKIGVYLAENVRIWRIKYDGIERYFVGFLHFGNMIKVNGFVFGKLIGQSVEEGTVEPVASSVSGPIGLAYLVDLMKRFGGLTEMVDLVANLSLTLAIVNILPFPALDGGHVLLLTIEGIRKKPINKKVERWMVNIGMILLFGFMILVTAKDFFQFGIWDWLRNAGEWFVGLFKR